MIVAVKYLNTHGLSCEFSTVTTIRCLSTSILIGYSIKVLLWRPIVKFECSIQLQLCRLWQWFSRRSAMSCSATNQSEWRAPTARWTSWPGRGPPRASARTSWPSSSAFAGKMARFESVKCRWKRPSFLRELVTLYRVVLSFLSLN